MTSIDSALEKRLVFTFKKYIRHALEHALKERAHQTDVIQVITNLQAALELLSKRYALKREGWRGIVEKRHHDEPESEVIRKIENGTIKTKQYWEHKDYIKNDLLLDSDDLDLVNKFQSYRNQVMHLGVVNAPKEILNDAIILVIRIFSRLEWYEVLPLNSQYMSNSLSELLGQKLSEKLLQNPSYVAEAVDFAFEISTSDVKFCLQCGHEAWAKDGHGNLQCRACGFLGNVEAFGFIDCPSCETEESVVYDNLNIGFNISIPSKCCACGKKSRVSRCKTCQTDRIFGSTCQDCLM